MGGIEIDEKQWETILTECDLDKDGQVLILVNISLDLSRRIRGSHAELLNNLTQPNIY
jgi:hypothetical protein